MKLNTKVLGGSLLAAGPLIIQFGAYPASWWLGFLFTTLGPFMMAIEPHKPKQKQKRKPKL